MPGMDFQEFLSRFKNVRQTGPHQYIVRCPAHDDATNSLSICQADSGLTLLDCKAKCSTRAVAAAIGLNLSDLYPPTEISPGGRRVVAAYDYVDVNGKLVYQSVRLQPKDFRQRQPNPNGSAGWTWNVKGCERVLYRLPNLLQSAAITPTPPVFIVEGEKDVDRLISLGLVATTNVGGAGKWLKKYSESLRNRLVAIIPDNDRAGRLHAVDITKKLNGISVKTITIRLPNLPPKGDVSDWLDAGGTTEQLLQYIESPPLPWPPLLDADDVAESKSDANDDDAKPITNADIEYVEDVAKVQPLPMEEILSRIFCCTNGWPRRVDTALFVHEPDGIHWLENASSFLGWLEQRTGVIEWRKAIGCVTKDELFQQLRRSAEAYLAIEHQPHFPLMSGHYYACKVPEPGNGEAIAKLVEKFSPATDHDEMLILALFATVFWGGAPGRRPAFLITSDDGRGVGKSILTDMVSRLVGGHIELSANEDASRLRTRLLSPRGLAKRVARLDNVKTLRFSWADLESVITSATISGHRLHVGEADRPNNLTWLITLNGPSLGTDIAQRVVVVKLLRPSQRVEAWESDTLELIDTHRTEIIADIRAFFDLQPEPIPCHGRWATWEGQVLARLANPLDIQKALFERAEEADVEREEIETIEEHFLEKLNQLGYLSTDAVHLPTKIAAHWFNEAMNEKRSTTQASKILRQFCREKRSRWISENPHRGQTRGFIFQSEFLGDKKEIHYDIQERIDRYWPRMGRF